MSSLRRWQTLQLCNKPSTATKVLRWGNIMGVFVNSSCRARVGSELIVNSERCQIGNLKRGQITTSVFKSKSRSYWKIRVSDLEFRSGWPFKTFSHSELILHKFLVVLNAAFAFCYSTKIIFATSVEAKLTSYGNAQHHIAYIAS